MTLALDAALAVWDEPSTSSQGAKYYAELSEATSITRAFLYPRDIGPATEYDRTRETPSPEQARAIQLLLDHDKGGDDTASSAADDAGSGIRVEGAGKGKGKARRDGVVQELVRDQLGLVENRFGLVRRDVQRYIGRMQETTALSAVSQLDSVMKEMLERLVLWQRSWAAPLKRLNDPKILNTFLSFFHSLLHPSLPPIFLSYLHTFLTSSLPSTASSAAADDLASRAHTELLQTIPMPRYKAPPPSPHLCRLGIFLRYSSVFMTVALEEIRRVAIDEAGKGWDARRLTRARMRVGQGVVHWVAGLMEGQHPGKSSRHRQPKWRSSLRNELGDDAVDSSIDLFTVRLLPLTDELFDIIVDYPDSMSALEDLKECLFKVDQRGVLVDKLKAANHKRLLHPGANTSDVLTQYISIIRCLRILDPPGVLLHKVAIPLRHHLRERPDTIKHLVAALVEGDELQDETENGGGLMRQGQQEGEEEIEDFTDPKWEPEPVDAAPEFRSGKAGDITSTLVSIYETKEVIVKELQILLAQRLLAVKDYDAVKEVRIIELLKLRFGEQTLQVCDVMLKDMADSKRIDDSLRGDVQTTLHPLIVSNRFWPDIPSSSLRLPKRLQDMHTAYESAFHLAKPDKHLRFMQQLGTALLRLEMSDRTIEVEATPLQASVAILFEEKDQWSVDALADRLEVDDKGAREALAFWAEEGLLSEVDGQWEVAD